MYQEGVRVGSDSGVPASVARPIEFLEVQGGHMA